MVSGCNTQLNEAKAKSLILDATGGPQVKQIQNGTFDSLRAGHFLAAFQSKAPLTPWLAAETTIDVNDPSSPGQMRAGADQLRRLVNAGFISKTPTRVVDYPLPGVLTGTLTQEASEMFGGNQRYPAELHPVINVAAQTINGYWNIKVMDVETDHGVLTGRIYTDGHIDLRMSNTSGITLYGLFDQDWPATLETNAGVTRLLVPRLEGNHWTFDFTGNLHPGEGAKLSWVQYAIAPQATKLQELPGEYDMGTIRIGDVTGLTLSGSDVASRASFAWSTELNDLGKAVYGPNKQLVGTGTASFSKKPDGTWILSDYSL
jgi:hypothetical protein